jgi:transposase
MDWQCYNETGENYAGVTDMRPSIDLNKILADTVEKTNSVRLQMRFKPAKQSRKRPRSASETFALCRAVVETVQKAKREGRLEKLVPIGYRIRWEK